MSQPNFLQSVEIPSRHQPGQHKTVMPEVYSWLFPPVQQQITEFMDEYPMSRFLENIHPGLDDAHQPMFQVFADVHPEIKGLQDFANTYPLAGSSEGIFHFIAQCIAQSPDQPLYALSYEYKGYGAFIESLGGKLTILDLPELETAPPGLVLLSNPSARDGNIIQQSQLDVIVARHQMFLDLAYIGITAPFDLDLSHPNVIAVVASLSKAFGLYYYRVGMMWSRKPIASLYGNRWFKNLHGILLGEKVIKHFQGSMYQWTAQRQATALNQINHSWQTNFVPSDVALLATMSKTHAPAALAHDLEPFLRGDVYRICLTPLMMKIEDQGAGQDIIPV